MRNNIEKKEVTDSIIYSILNIFDKNNLNYCENEKRIIDLFFLVWFLDLILDEYFEKNDFNRRLLNKIYKEINFNLPKDKIYSEFINRISKYNYISM